MNRVRFLQDDFKWQHKVSVYLPTFEPTRIPLLPSASSKDSKGEDETSLQGNCMNQACGRALKVVDWNSLLAAAARHAPIRYRWFGRTLSVEDIDHRYGVWEDWLRVKETLQADDKIWPFTFNANTLAMRQGYVFVRGGRPINCLITRVS